MKVGLISDTHGYIDDQILEYFSDVDEIWHAGDIGTLSVAAELEKIKPLKAVFGNIDGPDIRSKYPEHQIFNVGKVKIWMTHIGGYPPRYNSQIKKQLPVIDPNVFICGHSHILKVIPDKTRPSLIHINPGAAGHQGFHRMRTIIKMELSEERITDMKVVELGLRGR